MASSKISKIASQWLQRTALEVNSSLINIRALSLSLQAAFLDLEQEGLGLRIHRVTRPIISTAAEESEAKRKSYAIDLMIPQGLDPKIRMRALSLMWSGAVLDLITSPQGAAHASLETFGAQINTITKKMVTTEEDGEAKRLALRLISKLGIGRS